MTATEPRSSGVHNALTRPGSTARQAQKRAFWTFACAVLVVVAGLLVKEPELLLPMGPDQGTYGYVAERILDGGLPYVDAWDNKPPATYYLHAAVLALVPAPVRWTGTCIPGTTQPCGYVALQMVDVVWTALTALAVYAVARTLRFDGRATFAALLLFVVFANLSQLSKEGPTPEKQLLLPMVLAYLFALRRQFVLAGVAAAVAFLFKQTAVSIPLALVAWSLWEKRRVDINAIVKFGVGCAVVVLPVVAYFAWRGGLAALWDATFAYNFAQAGNSVWRIPYAALAGSWHVFVGSSAVLWLLGLGGALVVFSTKQRRLLVCWAVADALSLVLGGSKFAQVYYVQLVPSLSLLGGLAVASGLRALRAPLARAYATVVLAAVFLLSNQFQASVALRAWNERTPGRSSVSLEQQLALRLAAERPGGLFVWGDNSEIYLWAGARAPGRFFQAFALSRVYAERGYLARRAELLGSFAASPPGVVAIDPATARDDPDGTLGLNISSFPELRAFLIERYAPLDGMQGGWQAYKLRAAS